MVESMGADMIKSKESWIGTTEVTSSILSSWNIKQRNSVTIWHAPYILRDKFQRVSRKLG